MNNNMRLNLGLLAAFGATILASGCSGGAGSTSPVAGAKIASGRVIGSTKAQLKIAIPIRRPGAATSSQKRTPRDLSSSTKEIAILAKADSDTATIPTWQLFDVSSNAAGCTTTASVRSCVISVTAPLFQVPSSGTLSDDDFSVVATDQAPAAADTQPAGNYLSTGYSSVAVTAGTANPVNVLMVGVIGELATYPAPTDPTVIPSYSVWATPGSTGNVIVVNLTANAAAGGAIAGAQPTFDNPILFSDQPAPGTSSPFTYPSANPPANYGLAPPATPGPIAAAILYAAPTAGIAPAETVTVSTYVPSYPPLPNNGLGPTTKFTLDPMTISVAGAPVGSISGLSVGGTDVTVSVTEANATSFQITDTTNS